MTTCRGQGCERLDHHLVIFFKAEALLRDRNTVTACAPSLNKTPRCQWNVGSTVPSPKSLWLRKPTIAPPHGKKQISHFEHFNFSKQNDSYKSLLISSRCEESCKCLNENHFATYNVGNNLIFLKKKLRCEMNKELKYRCSKVHNSITAEKEKYLLSMWE